MKPLKEKEKSKHKLIVKKQSKDIRKLLKNKKRTVSASAIYYY